jgi:pimeloyl-ACP methyl ester carboxylesterase
MLHGQPGGPLDWHRVARALPDGFRAAIPDRPGYGHNPAPAGGLAANADDLIRELDERQIDRAVIAGHSWGGGVAVAAAERHPDRVAGIVLAASIGPGCLVPLDHVLSAPVIGEALSFGMLHALTPVLRRRLRRYMASGTVDPEDRRLAEERWKANRSRGLWRTFLVEQRAMLRELPALDDALASVACPAVVLAGSADRIVPPRTAEALAAAIPDADLRVIEGANHYLLRNHPEAVAMAIVDAARAPTRERQRESR